MRGSYSRRETYSRAHVLARGSIFGKVCANQYCGNGLIMGRGLNIQAALIHGRGALRAPDGKWYSMNPADYIPLCCGCHHAYDNSLGIKLKGKVVLTRPQA